MSDLEKNAVVGNPNAKLQIQSWMGTEHVAKLFGEASADQKRISKFIDLTPEQSAMSLDELRKLYANGAFSRKPPIGPAEKAKMIETIRGIIKTSHHKGEVDNAKTFYKKLTGKGWEE